MARRLKIAVYSIAKDEQTNVPEYFQSCGDADYVYVGVNRGDSTGELVEKLGGKAIWIDDIPFRFDGYRNIVLRSLPHDVDVCVSLDLDERLESGWRKKIESAWANGTTRLHYWLQWSEAKRFHYDRIHSRDGYEWRHANHECVYPIAGTVERVAKSDLCVTHKRDSKKDRSKNLQLLENAIKEEPDSIRMLWYLAREYYYENMYAESISRFKEYLAVGTWQEERCWACIYISRCLEDKIEAEAYLNMAIRQAPDLRDGYFELSSMLYKQNKLKESLAVVNEAVQIHTKKNSFIESNGAYSAKIYTLKARIHKSLGDSRAAEAAYAKALRIDPCDSEALEALAQ